MDFLDSMHPNDQMTYSTVAQFVLQCLATVGRVTRSASSL